MRQVVAMDGSVVTLLALSDHDTILLHNVTLASLSSDWLLI